MGVVRSPGRDYGDDHVAVAAFPAAVNPWLRSNQVHFREKR
jgi:hypothetical protein